MEFFPVGDMFTVEQTIKDGHISLQYKAEKQRQLLTFATSHRAFEWLLVECQTASQLRSCDQESERRLNDEDQVKVLVGTHLNDRFNYQTRRISSSWRLPSTRSSSILTKRPSINLSLSLRNDKISSPAIET